MKRFPGYFVGLEVSADDYLPKASPRVNCWSICAVLHRNTAPTATAATTEASGGWATEQRRVQPEVTEALLDALRASSVPCMSTRSIRAISVIRGRIELPNLG